MVKCCFDVLEAGKVSEVASESCVRRAEGLELPLLMLSLGLSNARFWRGTRVVTGLDPASARKRDPLSPLAL